MILWFQNFIIVKKMNIQRKSINKILNGKLNDIFNNI